MAEAGKVTVKFLDGAEIITESKLVKYEESGIVVRSPNDEMETFYPWHQLQRVDRPTPKPGSVF